MKQFSSNREANAQLPKLGNGELVVIAGRKARVANGVFHYTDGNVGRRIPRNVDGDVYQRTANGRARSAQ
jgi:hypothetical protein